MSDILELTRNYGGGLARDAWLKLVETLRTEVQVRRVFTGLPQIANHIVKLVPAAPYNVVAGANGATYYSFVTCQDIAAGNKGIARFHGEVDIFLDAAGPVPTNGSLILVSSTDGSLGTTSLAANTGLVGRVIDASQWTVFNRKVTIVLRFNCIRSN